MYGDDHLSRHRVGPVLPEIDPLPGSERQLAVSHGKIQVGVSEHAAHMGRHVVRALRDMIEPGVAVGYQVTHEPLQIRQDVRIRVFTHHEGGASVTNENVAKTKFHVRFPHGLNHPPGNVVTTAAIRIDDELCLKHLAPLVREIMG